MLISTTTHANLTKQGAEILLNSFTVDKGKAYLEYSNKIKNGSGSYIRTEEDKELYKMAYFCKMNAINTLIPYIVEQYPELTFTYKTLVDSAFNEETERKKINDKYGIKGAEKDCGEKVPLK